MRADMHVHTELCGHARGSVSEMVAAAAAAGLDVVAVTDHLPLPESYDVTYSMRADELAGYVEAVSRAAAEQDAAGGPEVLLGIEADWIPGEEERIVQLLESHPFDLVIGSVHFVDGWAFDDPALLHEWDARDAGEVWRAYFEDFERAASSGLFDVMAHPDLVKKFGHLPGFDPAPLYRSAAETLAHAGLAVEVSTAGLRKPVREIYPSLAFLRECARVGVPVTTGSDAHSPSEVAFRLDAAEELLREAGYDRIAVFRGRRMQEVPMEVASL